MSNIILGIDISKATFDVALLNNNKVKTKKFNNTVKGFSELKQWLNNKEVATAHVCMEATGGYEANLAQLLCARYFSPPLRQKRSPLHTNFFAALCHPPF